MIGETIQHYRIVEKLGSGGMGDVYKAEDLQLKRFVALKFLPREITVDEQDKQRFIHEAQAASALDHPNVGTIFQISESDGRAFMVMACYNGGSLKERIEQGPLPIDEAIGLACQIGRGLGKAHAGGIIHRDIKPANIMLTDDGDAKIVDFGLAKLAGRTVITKTGTTIGTVAYMSPEQAQGTATDHRTDLWSLGILIYEMLSGERPFGGEYDQAIVYSILNTDPNYLRDTVPDALPELEKIIEKALEKNPAKRYQSADEMLSELEVLRGGGDSTISGTSASSFRLARRQKKLLTRLAGIGGALLVVVLFGLYFLRSQPSAAEPISIAVLPLVGDTEEGDTEWFNDGMTDALITDLAQIDNVRVISRNSVMRYKGTDKSLSEIAEELNVTYVLDGSVGKTGDTVRITARLAEAHTDEYVWSKRYESDFTDVLDTQSQIAGAVAIEIHGELSQSDDERLSQTRTINTEIYEAYLRGMHHINKFEIAEGLAYLHEAVDLDPADPYAWTGLATGYITVGHGPNPVPDTWQRARLAAETAVRLDSTLAEARSVLGIVKYYYDWDWEAAEREFKYANTHNPSLALNHYHYAWYLTTVGRLDEAIPEHRLAEELDPLNPMLAAWMAEMYRMVGRHDDVEEQVQKAQALGNRSGISQLVLGFSYLDRGRDDEAVATREEMVSLNRIWKGILGVTYAKVGRLDDALRIASEIEAVGPTSLDAVLLAMLHASVGDADTAFEWANHEPPHAFVPWLAMEWSPFSTLKDDPRFDQFLNRLNLPVDGG